MNITEWVHGHRGIAHRREIAAAGFRRRAIDDAVSSGRIARIGRFWLADRTADPGLVRAASLGGRLACVSAARSLGLWTLDDDPRLHIAVPPRSMAPAHADLRLHRSIPLAPVRRSDLVESLVDVLAHVAGCLDRERALAVWESALRQARIHPDALPRVVWRSAAARRLADAAGVLSDSGLETLVIDRLRAMNLPVAQQVRLLGHPVDVVVGERLVIQIDGWAFHSSAADRARDNRHDARLRAAGYHVIRIGYAEVVHGWAAIEAEIMLAVAQGVHRAQASPAAAWVGGQ